MDVKIWDTRWVAPCVTMCTPEELGFCRYISDLIGSDNPVIYELGPWMGGSTLAFMAGNPGATIHTFDTFRWSSYMKPCYTARTKRECKYENYDSFIMEFLENIAWTKDCPIHVHQCNLETKTFYPGEPADVIFTDALKTMRSASNFVHNWLRKLKIGGYYIDQDFRWNPMTYVHHLVAMWRLRDHFKPIYRASSGALVCWKKESEPDDRLYKYAANKYEKSITDMPVQSQEVISALYYWKQHVGL